jgi:hypothetical protein
VIRPTLAWALLAISGCGAPRAAGAAAPAGWTEHGAAQGAIGVALPPGGSLSLDETGAYETWSAEGGHFGVLRRDGSHDLAALVLEGTREGARVTVEIDETVRWNGADAHRVRMRIERHVGREWVEDGASGERRHSEERDVSEVADYVSFRGSSVSVRAGYHLERGAPSETARALEAALESVRLRTPL